MPINQGSGQQAKAGDLGLYNLTLNDSMPFIRYNSASRYWRQYVNTNSSGQNIMYFQMDRNNDKVFTAFDWTNSVFTIQGGNDSGGIDDWIKTPGQVRASQYCDLNGSDCIAPSSNILKPVTCAAGSSNRWTGSAWACEVDDVGSAAVDTSSFINTSATNQVKAGNLTVNRLTTTEKIVSAVDVNSDKYCSRTGTNCFEPKNVTSGNNCGTRKHMEVIASTVNCSGGGNYLEMYQCNDGALKKIFSDSFTCQSGGGSYDPMGG